MELAGALEPMQFTHDTGKDTKFEEEKWKTKIIWKGLLGQSLLVKLGLGPYLRLDLNPSLSYKLFGLFETKCNQMVFIFLIFFLNIHYV